MGKFAIDLICIRWTHSDHIMFCEAALLSVDFGGEYGVVWEVTSLDLRVLEV